MARFLAYVDAVPGRLYPLVPTLLELVRRGHEVTIKAGIDEIDRLRDAGLHAQSLAPSIAGFEPDDWKARTRFGALLSGLRQFGERARDQATDLTRTLDAEPPDVLFIDEGAWGAAAVAEASGLPWAYSLVSAIPLTSRDAPPFGLGLRPRHDRIGRVRDAVARRLTLGTLERVVAGQLNGLRAELGVPPFSTLDAAYLAASLVLAYTAEPFEYPRTDWPSTVRLVGPGLWERRDRPGHLSPGGQHPDRALRPALTGNRPSRLRRVPRRYGDHSEVPRPRRPGRRGSLRTRPARSGPSSRGRPRRRSRPGSQAQPAGTARRGREGARARWRRSAHRRRFCRCRRRSSRRRRA